MDGAFIGQIMKQKREELGLSQEELCEGICSPPTLSRIENGRQAPGYNRMNALLQRLGLPENRYYALMTKQEVEIEGFIQDIMTCEFRYNFAAKTEKERFRQQGLTMLQELEQRVQEDDTITKQFVFSTRAILGKADGLCSRAEQRSLFLDALRLTAPKFDEEDISGYIYSYDEIKLITQIATIYGIDRQHKKAIDLFGQLLKYIKKNKSANVRIAKRIPMIAYNYALQLGIVGRYAEAVEIAEYGHQASIDTAHYKFLPGLAHIRAECYYRLGNLERSKDLYSQAYYTYKLLGDENNRSILEAEAEKYLGIVFL